MKRIDLRRSRQAGLLSEKRVCFPAFLILTILLTLVLTWQSPAAIEASAAQRPARITTCKLISANRIRIIAELEDPSAVQGKKCYLFSLSMSESKLTGEKPIQAKKKARKMSFTVSLNSSSSTQLYSRFFLAVKKADGTYQIISDAKYIYNPEKTAKYTYRFPKTTSKKGLQISSAMIEDAAELNVQHAAINIVFTEMIASESEYNRTSSIPYEYHGKTWWFRRSVVESYDRQLKALKENKAAVSAILLLGWRSDLKYLIYPSGRIQGHSFYAWNTSSVQAREHLQAAISFLASRYSTSSAKYGRIVNWIVGNEVNNYNVYNYAGKKSLSQYARIYANAFRLTYNTVTSVYANARVYISLDHLWNTKVSGAFTARKMLDAFAASLKKQGNIPWNLAYHPYSSPLTEPRFWENSNEQLTQALSSPVINMGNIQVLTSYIQKKYGSSTRIILSEQGYTSVRHGTAEGQETETDAEKEQSAAIAYSYYLTESNDMIDSFIMNRHVDHQAEVDQGLNLGLWTTDESSVLPETADRQKDSWSVFKYMDTSRAESVTGGLLDIIGIGDWSEVIDGYSKKLYSKTAVASAKLRKVKTYQRTASIPSKWKKYGAVSGMTAASGIRYVYRDGSRNRNCLWGFTQTFSSGISFRKNPMFYTALKVNGATGQKVQVKLRFFSGKQILESYGQISAGKEVRIGVSLKKWSGAKSVTKIQILIAPAGGSWNAGASLEMKLPVRGQ